MRESKLIQVSAEETKISVSKSGPNAKTFYLRILRMFVIR
jgi:hypothetical protein